MNKINNTREPELVLIKQINENAIQIADLENKEAALIAANHNLEVFKEELMSQNEELQQARIAAQELSDKYAEMYDFAPSSHFTLSEDGKIIELNLSSAIMLCATRSIIKHNPFEFFVSEESKPIFSLFLKKLFSTKIKESCELVLSTKLNEQICVLVSGIAIKKKRKCLISVTDISLHKIIQNLISTNRDLNFQIEEKEKYTIAQNLANIQLAYQNEEKKKRADELIIAYKKIVLQNSEKEKRAAELIIANIELTFQNNEKGKRASELIIANKELAFQSEEKEKRASELIIANKELAFQNKEKEQRASELSIANFELAYQNEEKEKRRTELIKVELHAKLNEEKLKLSAELIVTNKELACQIEEKEKQAVELITAKNKAEESERIKTAFLANMSHEIRTPMNGILGFTQLLKNPDLAPETQQKYISMVEKGGDRMLGIINDLIDISMIQSGMKKVILSACNINEKIEYTFSFFKPEVEKKGMTITYQNTLSEKEAIILTDREKVYAILSNLVKNAIKYSEKGSIEIGYNLDTKCNPPELIFFVKDTGIGVSPDKTEAIFNRFVQVENKLMRSVQGVGLGLSIAKSYVEMLSGKIWVESESGKGSTFYFSIPYNIVTGEIEKSVKGISTEEIEIPIKKLKILIADDDESSALLTSLIVEKYSSEIFHVSNGFDAIEICQQNPDIDLILMDINMPMMHGNEATRQIREFNKVVYIIAQTAYVFAEDKIKVIQAGCNDCITKPITQELLIKLIKNHFSGLATTL